MTTFIKLEIAQQSGEHRNRTREKPRGSCKKSGQRSMFAGIQQRLLLFSRRTGRPCTACATRTYDVHTGEVNHAKRAGSPDVGSRPTTNFLGPKVGKRLITGCPI